VGEIAEAWRDTYNTERPHDSLGQVPPLTFLPRPDPRRLPRKRRQLKTRVSWRLRRSITGEEGPMKRSKYSEEQVAYALRQVEAGTSVGDVCRQLGVNEATFYAWKKKYAHLAVPLSS